LRFRFDVSAAITRSGPKSRWDVGLKPYSSGPVASGGGSQRTC